MSSVTKRVGLKLAIFSAGLSQRKVARALGMQEARFSGICCGWHDPTEIEKSNILRILGKADDDADAVFGPNRKASANRNADTSPWESLPRDGFTETMKSRH
jgi:hypothetical protein